jgi:leucyl-tRNA synthetase
LYSRFWNKFLKDKGFAPTEEPFKKLINQGMILGMSAKLLMGNIFEVSDSSGKFQDERIELSKDIIHSYKSYDLFITNEEHFEVLKKKILSLLINTDKTEFLSSFDTISFKHSRQYNIPVDSVNLNWLVNIEEFKKWEMFDSIFGKAEFIEGFDLFADAEIEKMSKSKYNVVTPDTICEEYGADTLRLYEMFLGPLEQAKPWNTAGISGVFGFLKKLCRLYFDDNGLIVTNDAPTKDNLKSLHKTIKKVAEDIESFSFNTSVSQFMICVNELSTQNCHSRAILEPLAIVISPYAPHIAEELWSLLGNSGSIATVAFPALEEKHLVESDKEYPVSFNGKMRFTMVLPLDLTKEQIEEIVMKDERTIKQLEGRTPNKVIIVPGKIINLVG